jgi:hypothetical protein
MHSGVEIFSLALYFKILSLIRSIRKVTGSGHDNLVSVPDMDRTFLFVTSYRLAVRAILLGKWLECEVDDSHVQA